MSISRRGFFGLLAAGTAVAVNPELAELLLPKRTIFLPPKGGWRPRYEFNRIKLAPLYVIGKYDVKIDVGPQSWQQNAAFIAGSQWPSNLQVGDRITIAGINRI